MGEATIHKAPVIESLCLKFSEGSRGSIKPEDIKLWVAIAVSRCVRELSLSLFPYLVSSSELSSSLFTCKSLVILKLEQGIIMDVPHMVCLPKLKTLILRRVAYLDEKSLPHFVSHCPVLEDLFVEEGEYGHLRTLSVIAPSLQRLTLKLSCAYRCNVLVINTPSLKYLKVIDYVSFRSPGSLLELDYEEMPKLEEAYIHSKSPNMKKFVRSITFVKRLSLCLRFNEKKAIYGDGIVFNQLEYLKLRPCESNWFKLVEPLLKHSPNLRELEVYQIDYQSYALEDPSFSWQNHVLDCVPQCIMWSLKTFKWTGIKGSQEEINLLINILRNACCLKTATILFGASMYSRKAKLKFEKMIQEFSPGSTTCQLVFN